MKIVTASNGKKTVKMSKKEWQAIGKKAGWMKKEALGGGGKVRRMFTRNNSNLKGALETLGSQITLSMHKFNKVHNYHYNYDDRFAPLSGEKSVYNYIAREFFSIIQQCVICAKLYNQLPEKEKSEYQHIMQEIGQILYIYHQERDVPTVLANTNLINLAKEIAIKLDKDPSLFDNLEIKPLKESYPLVKVYKTEAEIARENALLMDDKKSLLELDKKVNMLNDKEIPELLEKIYL